MCIGGRVLNVFGLDFVKFFIKLLVVFDECILVVYIGIVVFFYKDYDGLGLWLF